MLDWSLQVDGLGCDFFEFPRRGKLMSKEFKSKSYFLYQGTPDPTWQSKVAVPLEKYHLGTSAVIWLGISEKTSDVIENRFSKQL